MRKVRNFIAWLLLVSGVASGLYLGLYGNVYLAIINAFTLHDLGLLTSALIVKTVFSCLCAPLIIFGGFTLGIFAFGIFYKKN